MDSANTTVSLSSSKNLWPTKTATTSFPTSLSCIACSLVLSAKTLLLLAWIRVLGKPFQNLLCEMHFSYILSAWNLTEVVTFLIEWVWLANLKDWYFRLSDTSSLIRFKTLWTADWSSSQSSSWVHNILLSWLLVLELFCKKTQLWNPKGDGFSLLYKNGHGHCHVHVLSLLITVTSLLYPAS